MNLNEQQKEVVNFGEGNCIVVSGGGSGKTRVLVERTKVLVKKGIPQKKILIITFTKDSAEDLRRKLGKGYKDVEIRTFHAFCLMYLNRYGKGKDLVNMDWRAEKYFQNIFGKDFDLYKSLSWISFQKNYGLTPNSKNFKEKEMPYSESEMRRIFTTYQEYLTRNKCRDFDDMLLDFIKLAKTNKVFREDILYAFKYVMVDEHQDSNDVQNKVLQLITGNGNLLAVGDYRQCLVGDTKIITMNGIKNISNITIEDKVLCASGRGEQTYGEVEDVIKKQIKKEVVEITTKSGNKLKGTPEHVIFANQVIENKYFVYLMYKKELGFRVGISSNYKFTNNGKDFSENGYVKRMSDETADKVWLLEVCDVQQRQLYLETLLAYKYKVLQFQFKDRGQGLNQESINKLFKEIGEDGGFRLLEDYGLSFDSPHNVPKYRRDNPYNMTYTLFGKSKRGKLGSIGSELSVSTSSDTYSNLLSNYGNVRKLENKDGFKYNNFRKSLIDNDEVAKTVSDIISDVESFGETVNLKSNAIILETNEKYDFVEMRNLRIGMRVATRNNDGILVEDEIVECNRTIYDGFVYDINIKNYRNYIANGIVSHNCIYSFRGSNVEHILEFSDKWKESKLINLPTNYRSTDDIIKLTNGFIKNYYGKHKLYSDSQHTDKGNGIIEVNPSTSVVDKIEELINNGTKPDDITILYRSHYLSADYEVGLREKDIPFFKVGDNKSFFDRPEIDAIIGYLALSMDNTNEIAYQKVYNVPNRFLSRDFLDRALKNKGSNLLTYKGQTGFEEKNVNNLLYIMRNIDMNNGSQTAVESVIKLSGIKDFIRDKYADADDRIGALNVLITLSKKIKSIKQLLMVVEKLRNTPQKQTGVRMMTVHASKGLEFENVFVVNVDDNVFPHEKSSEEEEARLFYVAMTRAISKLFIYGNSPFTQTTQSILTSLS